MDRAAEIRSLAERLADSEGVRDAWTAKSFTDRLVVVEVPSEGDLPQTVVSALRAHDCLPAGEVYDQSDDERPAAPTAAFAGDIEDGRRYRFVDIQSRGELQSYVVE